MCVTCGLAAFSYEVAHALPRTGFCTRLLKLHPASTPTADIVLDLDVVTDLSDADYEAVSWCWGRDMWDSSVRIRTGAGDACLQIPPNLDAALRRLRLADRYRALWVDALSIDQTSSAEKSRQVPLMADIYGSARRVCVWLGEGDEASARAVRFMLNELVDLNKFDQLCHDDSRGAEWLALIQFMEKPWFSRRWVIQEIALADQKTALLVCGTDSVRWTAFCMAALLFHRALDQSRLSFAQMDGATSLGLRYKPAFGAMQIVKAVSDLFRTPYQQGRPVPLRRLEYLVSSFAMYETSEPRDVIYSLLSVSRDGLQSDKASIVEVSDLPNFDRPGAENILRTLIRTSRTGHPFVVDYSAPVLEVYKQFMSFSVPRSNPARALDILCRPWAPDLPGEKFPSWVATLANAAYKPVDKSTLGRRLVRRNPDPLVGEPDTSVYSASRAIGPPRDISLFKYWNSLDRSMFVQGFVLDTIPTLEFPSQLGQIPSEWPTLAGWRPGSGSVPEEFWRTLVADRGPDGREPPSFYGPACETVFHDAMDDTLDTSMLINQGSSVVSDFLSRVQAVVWNRRMMRTSHSWLGLAPKTAREGDLICILYGCSVPVVLRRVYKSEADLEKEKEDEEIRRANVVAYIGKNLAARARRKRVVKAEQEEEKAKQESAVEDGTVTEWTGSQKRGAPATEQSDTESVAPKKAKTNEAAAKTNPVPSRKYVMVNGTQTSDYYYKLIGECYVHGMMYGESLTFRWNYNKGRPLEERINSEEFELR